MSCITYRNSDELKSSLSPRVSSDISLAAVHTLNFPDNLAALDKPTEFPLAVTTLAQKGWLLDWPE